MPRYSNSNSTDATLGWLRIPAGGTIDTESVFGTLPSGVTKVAHTPVSNPIINSQSVTGGSGTTTYVIPDEHNNYTIRIWCKAGKVTVKFNDTSIIPAVTLIAGEQMGFRVLNRTIGAVLITIEEGSTTWKLDVVKDSSVSWDV